MAYQLQKLKVLVVEDNWHMRALTKSLLSAFGIGHVDCVSDAEAAFKMFEKNKHDVLIVDWLMEPIDGIEFTKKLRADPNSPNPYVPIILMTGYSEKKRVETARDAGITEFLVKPFTSRTLFSRIEHIIERPRQFVKSKEYFGPDRRRIQDDGFSEGERRRSNLLKQKGLKSPRQKITNDEKE